MAESSDSKNPCWIEIIEPRDASPELAEMYASVGAVHNKLHNLYKAFSLQPKPLLAADRHYRDILHNPDNLSAPWLLELLASQAAIIAECEYALANHGANFKALLGDEAIGEHMLDAVRAGDYSDSGLFDARQRALLEYGEKLCRHPERMRESDVDGLRAAGLSDTEILEAVQASACFAYWVRFINGLGISLGDETIGMYRDGDK